MRGNKKKRKREHARETHTRLVVEPGCISRGVARVVESPASPTTTMEKARRRGKNLAGAMTVFDE